MTRPTDEDRKLAAEVAAWMVSLSEREQAADYLNNLAVYGRAGVVNMKGAGIVASAVVSYRRELERRLQEANKPDYSKSVHVGEVGKRIKRQKVRIIGYFTSEGMYGTTHIYKFLTEDGNVLTWFGSCKLWDESFEDGLGVKPRELKVGEDTWIAFTPKKFSEYKGVKETQVSRVTLVLSPEEEKVQKDKIKAEKKAAKLAEKAAAKGTIDG